LSISDITINPRLVASSPTAPPPGAERARRRGEASLAGRLSTQPAAADPRRLAPCRKRPHTEVLPLQTWLNCAILSLAPAGLAAERRRGGCHGRHGHPRCRPVHFPLYKQGGQACKLGPEALCTMKGA
jgi:hypothetical protein